MSGAWEDAGTIADGVRAGRVRAASVVDAALDRIAGERLNCFTAVLGDQARADAARIDAEIAAGRNPGPLAGVPFAVKNLFDVAGLVTLAGSKINRDDPPAAKDAAAVRLLRSAGAVLVGALNMDEYAYGFTTENSHYGPARNPYDPARTAGGSSGGAGAAVAAGLVPISLGTDTGGSVRVPAAFCGLYGLKPTYGRISREGTALFAPSIDHVGALTRSIRDLTLVYDLLKEPGGDAGTGEPRVALAGGYFMEHAEPEALAAARRVAEALGARREVEVPHVAAARSAAMIVIAVEGAALHLADLRRRPRDFDPLTRDRFLAGALLPGSVYARAQTFRRAYRDAVRALFSEVDILVAPTTPIAAPPIGQERVTLGGSTFPSRPHNGRFTMPFSFIGLPVISVPVRGSAPLPRGVQLVAAPFKEPELLRAAALLEAQGVAGFTRPY